MAARPSSGETATVLMPARVLSADSMELTQEAHLMSVIRNVTVLMVAASCGGGGGCNKGILTSSFSIFRNPLMERERVFEKWKSDEENMKLAWKIRGTEEKRGLRKLREVGCEIGVTGWVRESVVVRFCLNF